MASFGAEEEEHVYSDFVKGKNHCLDSVENIDAAYLPTLPDDECFSQVGLLSKVTSQDQVTQHVKQ